MSAVKDAGLPDRVTSPVELLWDLVFAFAVTQVTTLLSHAVTWAGLARSLLVLALIWWAWSAFVWVSNAQDPRSRTFRATLLAGTVIIFVTGLAVPRAFGAYGTLFAVTYAIVRLLHLGLYVDSSRQGNASLRSISGFAITVVIGMALLIAGSFATGTARFVLWLVAAAIDYGGPGLVSRGRLRGLQQVAVAHFAERYGLFIIICLGESVVAIGLGASGHPLGAAVDAAAALSLLIAIGMWWIYFDRFAEAAQQRLAAYEDPVLVAADGYSYLHLPMVAGIIIFAVGGRSAVAHGAASLPAADRLALCAGVALYLVGHAAFRARMVASASRSWLELASPAKLVAAGACLVVAALGGVPAWGTAAIVAALLALLVAWEVVAGRQAERGEPAELAEPAGRDEPAERDASAEPQPAS